MKKQINQKEQHTIINIAFKTGITFTRVKRDLNGNSRFVCSWQSMLTDQELNSYIPGKSKPGLHTAGLVKLARKRGQQLGGRKYRGDLPGGTHIVFQSYTGSLEELAAGIIELRNGGK